MPHDQFVPLGEPARLYCEAFVGKVKLPDARNFISWYQIFDNDQEAAVDGIQQTITRYVNFYSLGKLKRPIESTVILRNMQQVFIFLSEIATTKIHFLFQGR